MDSDSWNTPPEILDRVRAMSPIALDPCSNATSLVGAKLEFRLDQGDDGLALPWYVRGLVFVNPPYSRGNLLKWAEKIHEQAQGHAEIIALVPAKIETRYWKAHFWHADLICFPSRRIRHYVDGAPRGSGRFPSALCYFGHRPEAFRKAFSEFGVIVRGGF